MTDTLVRATARGVRLYAVDSTGLAEEARSRHGCRELAAAALGRILSGALLLSATFKEGERITIKLAGDGPLGQVVADAGQMTVRGYVDEPAAELPPRDGVIDVGGGVGRGKIVVTRFTGLKSPVTGSAELVSGEVAQDIAHYLYISEQIPSCLSLGVEITAGQVTKAGGFFIQAMPAADERLLAALEATVTALPPVTSLLRDCLTPRDLIEKICGQHTEPFIHDETPVAFRCACSRAGVKQMLLALPDKDRREIAGDEETRIRCHFCNTEYIFTRAEVARLLGVL
jgi:molecular chaperone Hsp33